MPQRIQRLHGVAMPPNTVYVGRPSRWAMPIDVADQQQQADAVAAYRDASFAWTPTQLEFIRRELAGKNVACWCSPSSPCHGDVLLAIANQGAR